MKIAILTCADCDTEIDRTEPFPDKDENKVRMTSAFAGPCPKGCPPTFSDLNIHTKLKVIEAGHDL